MRQTVFFALITLMVAFVSPVFGETAASADPLVIESAGKRHEFRVELATTPEQQARGLMYRRSLDADAGMLFVYARPQELSMWMKNTLIPLDMVFIRPDGTILRIAERTVPESLAIITSDGVARGVLEIAGGTASRLGIKAGDRVVHPALRQIPAP